MTQKKVPNAVTGGVDVEVGGQKYTLLLSNRIIMEIEDETGLDLYDRDNLLQPKTRFIATVFHALLKRAGADLTFDDVVEICAGKNRAPIQLAIITAMGNALPTEEQVKLLDPTMAGALKKAQQTELEAFQKGFGGSTAGRKRATSA
ncbi:MAG TPA: hypothetical protein VK638_17825 [Edaphobacter sp.]|nr:hypothetical protein [Edaphobacter sp.]